MMNLPQNIFETDKMFERIQKENPNYFDIDCARQLIKKIESLDFSISYFWYKLFYANLLKKIKILNKYKGKVLILIGVKGFLVEALLTFLSHLSNNFDLFDFCQDEHCDNTLKSIEEIRSQRNVRFNLKIIPQHSLKNINKYNYVISLGLNPLLPKLLKLKNIKPKLVLIDVSLYHAIQNKIYKFINFKNNIIIAEPKQKLYVYSCQINNFFNDYRKFLNPKNIQIKFFNYLPAYLLKFPQIKSRNYLFDILILSKNDRDFTILNMEQDFFKNKKILFLAGNNYVEAIANLKKNLNITILPRIKHALYIKLLAVSKLVFVPINKTSNRVYLSISDAMAMGKPVVTTLTGGSRQLLNRNKNIIAVKSDDNCQLKKEIDKILESDEYRKNIGKNALDCTRHYFNIDLIYLNIFKDLFN